MPGGKAVDLVFITDPHRPAPGANQFEPTVMLGLPHLGKHLLPRRLSAYRRLWQDSGCDAQAALVTTRTAYASSIYAYSAHRS
jgi:hypothetical protein